MNPCEAIVMRMILRYFIFVFLKNENSLSVGVTEASRASALGVTSLKPHLEQAVGQRGTSIFPRDPEKS